MVEYKLLIAYDLQFFAKDGPGGEKTEEATPKRKTDARKKGQVAKSKELGTAFLLLTFFLVIKLYIGTLGMNFLELFAKVYERMPQMIGTENGEVSTLLFSQLLNECIKRFILMMLPFFLSACAVAVIVDLIQVKWKPTREPLKPKFSKLNPVKGFSKFFKKEKLMELLKSVIKLFLVGYLAYSTLRDQLGLILLLPDMALINALGSLGDVIVSLGIRISIFYLIFGFADYVYEHHKFKEDLKMTKQEVKDEMKNSEGDPKIKSQQRRRMMQASRRRMMNALPQADVVITNPTHFAVALKYDLDVCPAPYVIAKGADFLAAKMKETAREHQIEIVENKPLARMLYYNVDVDTAIPPELYQVVAEILAAVYKTKNKAS